MSISGRASGSGAEYVIRQIIEANSKEVDAMEKWRVLEIGYKKRKETDQAGSDHHETERELFLANPCRSSVGFTAPDHVTSWYILVSPISAVTLDSDWCSRHAIKKNHTIHPLISASVSGRSQVSLVLLATVI